MREIRFTIHLLATLCMPAMAIAQKIHAVHLVVACSFGQEKPRLDYWCSPKPPASISDLITDMIHFNGNSSDGIVIEDSPGLKFPVTGIDSLNIIYVVVDAKKLLHSKSWPSLVTLAHELGHITNRDLYRLVRMDRARELKADYYAGFWAHRAGCHNMDSLAIAYKNVPTDKIHPSGPERVVSVKRGYDDEEIPFELQPVPKKSVVLSINNPFGIPQQKDIYGPYMDMFATIMPYKWLHVKKTQLYKVKVQLNATDFRIPMRQLLSAVATVEYSTASGLYILPFVSNKSNNYELMAIGTWTTLPITCTIHFTDNSSIQIKRYFMFRMIQKS